MHTKFCIDFKIFNLLLLLLLLLLFKYSECYVEDCNYALIERAGPSESLEFINNALKSNNNNNNINNNNNNISNNSNNNGEFLDDGITNEKYFVLTPTSNSHIFDFTDLKFDSIILTGVSIEINNTDERCNSSEFTLNLDTIFIQYAVAERGFIDLDFGYEGALESFTDVNITNFKVDIVPIEITKLKIMKIYTYQYETYCMRYEFYGCNADNSKLQYPAVISLAMTPPRLLIARLDYMPTFLVTDAIWSGGYIPWTRKQIMTMYGGIDREVVQTLTNDTSLQILFILDREYLIEYYQISFFIRDLARLTDRLCIFNSGTGINDCDEYPDEITYTIPFKISKKLKHLYFKFTSTGNILIIDNLILINNDNQSIVDINRVFEMQNDNIIQLIGGTSTAIIGILLIILIIIIIVIIILIIQKRKHIRLISKLNDEKQYEYIAPTPETPQRNVGHSRINDYSSDMLANTNNTTNTTNARIQTNQNVENFETTETFNKSVMQYSENNSYLTVEKTKKGSKKIDEKSEESQNQTNYGNLAFENTNTVYPIDDDGYNVTKQIKQPCFTKSMHSEANKLDQLK